MAVPTVSALLSADEQKRDQALQLLYQNSMVRAKVSEWLSQYKVSSLAEEDVVQEGIIKLYDNVRSGKFRAESKLTTFLLGICLNIIRNGGRKAKYIQYQSEIADDADATMEQADSQLLRVEMLAEDEQRDALLREAYQQLRSNCQQALRIFHMLSKSMADVALALGLKNATQARKLTGRCREYLRKIIRENSRFQRLQNL